MTEYDQPDSDPVVAEVRAAREAIAARFNYDLKAIFDYGCQQVEEMRRRGEIVVEAPINPVDSSGTNKKAG